MRRWLRIRKFIAVVAAGTIVVAVDELVRLPMHRPGRPSQRSALDSESGLPAPAAELRPVASAAPADLPEATQTTGVAGERPFSLLEHFTAPLPPPTVPIIVAAVDAAPVVPRKLIEFDATQTSWQDPFDAVCWDADGWSFDGRGMRSAPQRDARATFRRLYRKIRLELTLETGQLPHDFEIELAEPNSGTILAAQFDTGGIVVVSGKSAETTELVRRDVELRPTAGQPLRLGLAATGNRVQIVWNGGRILTFTQPAAQSGAELQLSLISHTGALHISSLRLEGE
jgi:hypothetical protein